MSAAPAPIPLTRILVGLDASDHANRALSEAARLAASAGGTVTGLHVYAAALHDRRFRQMEGGLPDRYRVEAELERQRAVHDGLIGRGLGIISDSYHDAAARLCEAAAVPYRRLSLEGKNYRRIVEAVGSGEFDLLVIGARGLGAVPARRSLEQNDEWAVQRRYMSPETMAAVSDDPNVTPPALAAA